MLITLPMYDYPELRTATEAWAQGVARHAGVAAYLTRLDDYQAAWARDDLGFSQTCGYPLTHAYKGKLSLVGTPHYAVSGCEGYQYSSVIFGRHSGGAEAYRGAVPAVNTPDSMSGMLALKVFFARAGVKLGETLFSGSHLNSLALLQQSEAEICAIDAVCVDYAQHYRPEMLHGLYEIGRGPSVPGLPYVTRDTNEARWRKAVQAAVVDPALADARAALRISGFTPTTLANYDAILQLEAELM